MAQTMFCDGDDNEVAVLLVTNIEEADVKAFCVPHFADFCQAFLQAFAPDRLAPVPKPAARKSRAKASRAVADDSEGGEGNAETSKSPAEGARVVRSIASSRGH